jgi:acyl carrier protein
MISPSACERTPPVTSGAWSGTEKYRKDIGADATLRGLAVTAAPQPRPADKSGSTSHGGDMPITDTESNVAEERRTMVKEIVCEILEIDPSEMTGTSLFKEDHGADSMGSIEILSSLEKKFGVDIDQSELARMVNLDNVVAVVEESATP